MSASAQLGRFSCSTRHRRTSTNPYALDATKTPAIPIGTITLVPCACSTLATVAANAAPTLVNTSASTGFISRLHAVGPGGGLGASVAKNEHPVSERRSRARIPQRHGPRTPVAELSPHDISTWQRRGSLDQSVQAVMDRL